MHTPNDHCEIWRCYSLRNTSSYHIRRRRELWPFTAVRDDLRRQPLERQCMHCRSPVATESKVANLNAEVGVDPASCLCLFVYTTTLSQAVARGQAAMKIGIVVQIVHAGGDLLAEVECETDG